MPLAVVVYLGVVGAAVGSFIDALVWRLHTGGDLMRDGSRCESCRHRLGPAELVPVLSWVLLRGRCRHCGARIGALSPLVEASLATAFVASAASWPGGVQGTRAVATFVTWLLCLATLTALVCHDLRWLQLPNLPLLVLAVFALAQASLHAGPASPSVPVALPITGLLGAAALGGGHLILHVVSRGRWVGMGDVKLAAVVGLLTGWYGGLLAIAVANALGAVVGLTLLATGRLRRGTRVPLGPFLAVGLVVAVLINPM